MAITIKTEFQLNDKQLFGKIAGFTDIHYGRKGNDRQSNQDNSDFVDWFIDEAKKFGADIVVCMGDWHDNRNTINVGTMNYSLDDLNKLAKSFKQFIIIVGNHDLYYRDRRDINSVEFGRNVENLTLIKEPTIIGDCAFVPWLVGDEWKDIPNIKSKYMFGHFEIPTFYMNAMVEMPDHGHIRAEHFKNQDLVFSGHFHKRQRKGNILYTGNVFPFNFADVNDDDRGAFFMEWGQEPEFKAWPDAPKFRTMKVSELLSEPEKYILPRSYNRAFIDIDISYEEAQFLRETLLSQFDARKIDLIPVNKEEQNQDFDGNVAFQSVDQIVLEGLRSVQGHGIDTEELIRLYEELK
jgi:DNA repair exonuclease SbcCD nuclease subunit